MLRTICAFSAGFSLAAWIGWSSCTAFVDQRGVLQEPFALVPLGLLSGVIAAGTGAALVVKRLARQGRSR